MSNEEDWADSTPYDIDELLGPPPRGFRRRWEWYKKMEQKESKNGSPMGK